VLIRYQTQLLKISHKEEMLKVATVLRSMDLQARGRPVERALAVTIECDSNHIQRAMAARHSTYCEDECGEEWCRMEKPDLDKYKPCCNLAHEFVNKLSAIVGYCELMEDRATEDPECRARLEAIRKIAKEMAEALATHQCELHDLIRQDRKKPRTRILM